MTGGVSLAIWMGGVARELNLLDQASRQREGAATVPLESLDPADREVRSRYLGLLELLDVVVRIDVLSGTSAGGINAALLAMCHATGWDLGWLRDVWLTAGDLELLLRDPASKDPPSLLRGDGVLLAQLEDNVKRPGVEPVEEARSTTVYITTTLLDGETSRFTDSYGTLVPDVDHLGVFRFTQEDLRSEPGRCALALAARSSASFPAAFEPAFLPYGEAVKAVGKDSGPGERPAMNPFSSITRSHWAADGGILANRPIRPILDSIFDQPARGRQVRRALLYVVPDPGGTPRPVDDPDPEARIDQPLPLSRALLGDMSSALNQSIASELTAIQQHNDRVDAMRDSRLRLAELGVALAGGGASRETSGAARRSADVFPTDGAWDDYVSRQGQWLVRPLVRSIMTRLSTLASSEMPDAWKADLSMGNAIENTCCAEASEAVTSLWIRPSPAATPEDLATLGRLAYDGVKGIIVSLVQLGYSANPTTDRRQRLAVLGQRLHAAYRPGDSEPLQTLVTLVVDNAAAAANPPSLVGLTTHVALAWSVAQNAGTNDAADGPPVAARAGLPAAWELLQRLLQDLVPELAAIAADDSTTPNPAAVAAKTKLTTYLAYLGGDSSRWACRVVGLHVMDRSILPVAVEVDQKVELIQVSATTRTLLDPARTTPSSKLTGTQFHHFGAFYKASWRANDWMWGRLDGAGWLVHVLLDPRRIRTIADADPSRYPPTKRAAAFLQRLADVVGSPIDPNSERAQNLLMELAFLDGSDDPPLSLPETALWLAENWQRAIVAMELPVVAREALAAPTKRDQTWAVGILGRAGQADLAEAASRQAVAQVGAGHTARMARRDRRATETETATLTAPPNTSAAPTAAASTDSMPAAPAGRPASSTSSSAPPDAAASTSPLLQQTTASIAALLQSCPVPAQKLSQERGEPLFTRTVAKATAVATAAATAVQKPPATINTVFRTARTTTLTGYRAANAVGFWPRRLIAAGAGIAALGVLLAAQGSTILGFTGVALLLAGLYLVAFGVWSTSPRILGALLAVTLVAGVFALTIPLTRRTLFGTADGTERGWVNEHFVPWMRDRWWALVLVLAVVILVPAAASFVGKWLADRRVKNSARSRIGT
jgi:patatin-related protein